MFMLMSGLYGKQPSGSPTVTNTTFDMDLLGLIPSALGFVGNILGLNSQSSANEANVQLTRETNAQNYRMFTEGNEFNRLEAQRNRDFQTQMFDATNQWNSAMEQRKRLEQAGLNPYLMMNGGNAGTAAMQMGSQAQSASANPAVPGHVVPLDYGRTGNDLAQSLSIGLDNELKAKQLKFEDARLEAYVRTLVKKGDLDEASAGKILQDTRFDKILFGLVKREKAESINKVVAEYRLIKLKEVEQEINNAIGVWTRDVYNPQKLAKLKKEIWAIGEQVKIGHKSADAAATQAAALMIDAGVNREKYDEIKGHLLEQYDSVTEMNNRSNPQSDGGAEFGIGPLKYFFRHRSKVKRVSRSGGVR